MINFPGSLHNHSEYSNIKLRDSINRTAEMMEYAGQLGHEVLGITEHETISNAVKIEKEYKAIKEKYPNLKVIRGNEIYLCRDGLNGQNFVKGEDKYYHFILLAKDGRGHEQIRELSTRAWMRSYSQGKMRRTPTYYQDLLDIIGADPGHVIASTACLGGFLGTKLLQYRSAPNVDFYKKIEQWLMSIENVFGKGHFFLEMQPSNNDEQTYVNKEIIKLSERLDIPYIITTDSHYLKKEDAPIHKAFLNSQDGEREVDSFYETTYMMGTEELESFFPYFTSVQLQKAYTNILTVKNMCEDYSLLRPLNIPSLEWKKPQTSISTFDREHYIKLIPNLATFYNSDFLGDKVMVDLIIDKLKRCPELQYQESYEEINNNLQATWDSSLVNKAHWSAYFLNLQKIIDVCWDAGTLVGPGRGSGVGFYLLYILDIIQINCLWENTKTFQWRFLNPDRVSPLDIDTDIEGSRRAQVLAALRKQYGEDRVAGVVTFGTEGSKSAIQTAARGLGIDNDISLYISSLIPADRGQVRSLRQCYYGDADKGFDPIPMFRRAMKEQPELWAVAQKIEGLVSRIGEHAGGIIFVDEPFTKSTGLLRVPNGDIVTQYDLHDAEECSLIKIDLLSIEALDKIHTCLDLLCEHGYIDLQPTLRETYEKYIGIYKLEREDSNMWNMVWEHQIQALFQMEQQSGIQGIALIKPTSVDELAVLNSVIRLMAQEKGGDTPLVTWSKYRKDIDTWIKEMQDYGLTESEILWLRSHSAVTDGICESQEGLMSLVQEPRLGGNSLNFADKCRKALAKKIGKLFIECEQEFFANAEAKGCSMTLAHYVWDILLSMQRGYSFNRSHTLAYSLVALQEMNLAFRWPLIFWNTACLITDSGGAEDQDEPMEEIVDIYEPEDFDEYEYIDAPDKKTKVKKKRVRAVDYKKIAIAIGKMIQSGVEVCPPNINSSSYTFTPNVEENKIIFGLSGLLNVGEDIILTTIENRPYSSPRDYLNKVKPKKSSMISLIKAGAFDEMMDRRMCMAWYLWEVCDKKQRLTLQNMPGLIKYEIVPGSTEEFITARRVYEFNRYLKAMCKYSSEFYRLDDRALNFIIELGYEDLILEDNLINIKLWDKKYQLWMDTFRYWINENKDKILEELNTKIFKEEWDKYASGTISSWEMEVMCYYYHEHELAHLDNVKYGISNFFDLSEEPIVERSFVKGDKTINLFKLTRIAGTCIAKDKNKATVSLLTPNGVVTVKYRKEYFALFDKQVSEKNPDGTKTVKEKSWFNRGQKIMVQGMRSGDQFMAKKYGNSNTHQLYRISAIYPDGSIELQDQRYQEETQ